MPGSGFFLTDFKQETNGTDVLCGRRGVLGVCVDSTEAEALVHTLRHNGVPDVRRGSIESMGIKGNFVITMDQLSRIQETWAEKDADKIIVFLGDFCVLHAHVNKQPGGARKRLMRGLRWLLVHARCLHIVCKNMNRENVSALECLFQNDFNRHSAFQDIQSELTGLVVLNLLARETHDVFKNREQLDLLCKLCEDVERKEYFICYIESDYIFTQTLLYLIHHGRTHQVRPDTFRTTKSDMGWAIEYQHEKAPFRCNTRHFTETRMQSLMNRAKTVITTYLANRAKTALSSISAVCALLAQALHLVQRLFSDGMDRIRYSDGVSFKVDEESLAVAAECLQKIKQAQRASTVLETQKRMTLLCSDLCGVYNSLVYEFETEIEY